MSNIRSILHYLQAIHVNRVSSDKLISCLKCTTQTESMQFLTVTLNKEQHLNGFSSPGMPLGRICK